MLVVVLVVVLLVVEEKEMLIPAVAPVFLAEGKQGTRHKRNDRSALRIGK